MIYQEQVMQIAQVLAGYTLGGADLLRRAMGKKIKAEMEAQRKAFIDGAVGATGCTPTRPAQIFDQVNKFAGYGFNKSHAAAYALVAYQTAYLKANYPVEFLAASMTLDLGNTDKLNVFRQELTRLGIELLPPDINNSQPTFSVERQADGRCAVRYALAAVKNVGLGAMQTLVEDARGGRAVPQPRRFRASASTPRRSTSASSRTWSRPAPSTHPPQPQAGVRGGRADAAPGRPPHRGAHQQPEQPVRRRRPEADG